MFPLAVSCRHPYGILQYQDIVHTVPEADNRQRQSAEYTVLWPMQVPCFLPKTNHHSAVAHILYHLFVLSYRLKATGQNRHLQQLFRALPC